MSLLGFRHIIKNKSFALGHKTNSARIVRK